MPRERESLFPSGLVEFDIQRYTELIIKGYKDRDDWKNEVDGKRIKKGEGRGMKKIKKKNNAGRIERWSFR